MSNKPLEMFDGVPGPTSDDHAYHVAAGGKLPALARAANDALHHMTGWLTPRLIRIARRTAIVAVALLCLGLGVLGYLWQATPSTADLAIQAHADVARHHAPYTSLAAIAITLPQAVVAIEDEHFYQHHGIDTIGLTRAVWDDLRAGHLVEGGSTITAQLAKLVYLQGFDHTFPRKAQDLVLALKIEQRYTKGQIMEMYLNVAYYGENAYGIGAAAAHYFGVAPAKLDLAQATLLAGLLQAPGAYDPWCHAALARSRQHAVLARMELDGDINQAQASAAASEVLPFWTTTPGQHPPCTA